MTLIGIGGAAAAGKDTLADFLVERYGFVKIGMSDPLQDALLALDPLIPVPLGVSLRLPDRSTLTDCDVRYRRLIDLVGYTEAKRVPEVRRLLQVLGTEVGRKMLGENIWVEAMERKILEYWQGDVMAQNAARIVVTGIRFPNELELIHKLGDVSLYVTRGTYTALGGAGANAAHASETSLSAESFRRLVDNHGTMKDLERWVDSFAQHELGMSPLTGTIHTPHSNAYSNAPSSPIFMTERTPTGRK